MYADRANLASARRAAALWSSAVAGDPRNAEAAWKLARVDYWLGNHAPESERRGFLETGIDAGRKAAALQPNRPEGHFWIAANMGALAESFGLRQGLKYRKPIKDAIETALRLDPAFMDGSADRALGPLVFQGAAPVRRRPEALRDPSARIAELQPEQHGVALLSR